MAELFSELDQIDNLEDFKVYRSKLIKKSAFWKQRVLLLKKKGGYKSNKDLAEACCVTVPTVRNWLAGKVPRSRDNFIKIGFAEKIMRMRSINSYCKIETGFLSAGIVIVEKLLK